MNRFDNDILSVDAAVLLAKFEAWLKKQNIYLLPWQKTAAKVLFDIMPLGAATGKTFFLKKLFEFDESVQK